MRLLVGCMLMLLAGCHSLQPQASSADTDRHGLRAQLVLHAPLEIGAGEASLRLQFGRVVPRNGVQGEEPHCILEVENFRETPQTIRPDTFSILSVRRGISDFGHLTPQALLVWRTWRDEHRPTFIYYQTVFRLHSIRQPKVRSLTCQSNQNAPGIGIMRHLSLAEIRSALRTHFTLQRVSPPDAL